MGTFTFPLSATWLCCLLASPAIAQGTVDAASPEANERGAEAVPPPDSSAAAPQSDWRFSFKPYLWLAGLKGDIGETSAVAPVAVDLSFGDILKHLKIAAMGTLEASNGRFVASADTIYMSVGASKNIDIRDITLIDGELKAKFLISTMTAGYRVVDRDRLSVDLMAGGRLNVIKTTLDLRGPTRNYFASKTETWVDPVAALRFRAPLGPRWSLATYGDVGGFGYGSHLTWQLSGVVHYTLSTRWDLSAGWRHLDIDYHNNGFVFDAAMDGPIVGAVYRF